MYDISRLHECKGIVVKQEGGMKTMCGRCGVKFDSSITHICRDNDILKYRTAKNVEKLLLDTKNKKGKSSTCNIF